MKIQVSDGKAVLIRDSTLVQGSSRVYPLEFEFDESWEGYEKTAVFQAGAVTEYAALENDACDIPASCLEQGGAMLLVGVCGSKDGVNTETIWCTTSRILYGVTLETVPETAVNALRSCELEDHVAKFYTTDDLSGDPAFTMTLPEEIYVDQAHTQFVSTFVWRSETYPGSTNPHLNGRPVFVLAIASEDSTNPTYSFLNMQTLADIYQEAAGDGSASVTIDNYRVSVNVNVSTQSGNILEKDSTGKLYVALPSVTASGEEIGDMLDEVFPAGGE